MVRKHNGSLTQRFADQDAITKECLDSVYGIFGNECPFGRLSEECDRTARKCIALENQPSASTNEIDDHVLG